MGEHIVISMDSHTELAVDLKPYLPQNMHEAFDTGVADATRWFARASTSMRSQVAPPVSTGSTRCPASNGR